MITSKDINKRCIFRLGLYPIQWKYYGVVAGVYDNIVAIKLDNGIRVDRFQKDVKLVRDHG